jgi:hypothetical protein
MFDSTLHAYQPVKMPRITELTEMSRQKNFTFAAQEKV